MASCVGDAGERSRAQEPLSLTRVWVPSPVKLSSTLISGANRRSASCSSTSECAGNADRGPTALDENAARLLKAGEEDCLGMDTLEHGNLATCELLNILSHSHVVSNLRISRDRVRVATQQRNLDLEAT